MYAILICTTLSCTVAQTPDRSDLSRSLLDGSWTVVTLERDGQAVPGAKGVAVTLKDNVATFAKSKADGADRIEGHHLRAMQFTFGPKGILQAIEANADGRFDTPGVITPTKPVGNPNQPSDNKLSPAPVPGTPLTGVYAITKDYLVVSVLQASSASSTNYLTAAEGASSLGNGPVVRTYFTFILKRVEPETSTTSSKK